MSPIDIISKYYKDGSALYELLLAHSVSVMEKAIEVIRMASPEWNIDETFVREAAMLHDIGIFMTNSPKIYCFGEYPYICHGYLGANILRQENLDWHARVCERHIGTGLTYECIVNNNWPLIPCDMLPETPEEKLICFADKFYSKSYPDKRKTYDEIRRSLAYYGEDTLRRWDELMKLFVG